eukprot:3932656-Rhodomonas_salina.1
MIALKYLAMKRVKCKGETKNMLNLSVVGRTMDSPPDYTVCEHLPNTPLPLCFHHEKQLAVIAFANNDTEIPGANDSVGRAQRGVPCRVLNWNDVMNRFPQGKAHLMFMAASIVNIVILPLNVTFTPETTIMDDDVAMGEFVPRDSEDRLPWNARIGQAVGEGSVWVYANVLVETIKSRLDFKGKPDNLVTEFNVPRGGGGNTANMLHTINDVLNRMEDNFRHLHDHEGKSGMALRFRTLHLLLILNQGENDQVKSILHNYIAGHLNERDLTHALQMKWHELQRGALRVEGVSTRTDWYRYLNMAMMLQTISGIQVAFDSRELRVVHFRTKYNKKSYFLFSFEGRGGN